MVSGTNLNDGYFRALIRCKAHRLTRTAAFRGVERDDLIQDLTVIVLGRLRKFDPQRSAIRTFVSRVVDSAAITLWRARMRAKRGGANPPCSIEALKKKIDSTPAFGAETVAEDDGARRLGRPAESAIDQSINRQVVREIIDSLPPEQADRCRRLMESTEAAVARDLGISRRQMRKHVLELRERFGAGGFGSE